MRTFQLHLSQTGTSIQTRNRTIMGLRFLFRVTRRRLDLANEIHHIKEPTKIPQILSAEEAARLLTMAGNLHARVLLSIGYGAGLRVSEAVKLKVKHIDASLEIIRVEQGKGRRDRHVMLSPELYALLREWWPERSTKYDDSVEPQEDAARASPLVRDAPVRPRYRHPDDPSDARPREARDDGTL